MTYQVIISRRATKSIEKLNEYDRTSVRRILSALSIDPRPRNAKKFVNTEMYRVRVSDYRIIYTIIDREIVVNVVELVHRKNAYR